MGGFGMSDSSEHDTSMSLGELLVEIGYSTPRPVYRALERGELVGFKLGGQWRFKRSEVEAWKRRCSNLARLADDPA